MTTLALKRKHTGIYFVENEVVYISISNPYAANGLGSNSWQVVITNKLKDEELRNEWFDTKKEASQWGAKWVIANL